MLHFDEALARALAIATATTTDATTTLTTTTIATTTREATDATTRGTTTKSAPALGVEHAPLEDAVGRVLAEDLLAPYDLPSFDYSAMDGYALRFDQLVGDPPYAMPVRGESRTGALPPKLEPRSAMRIFTGAKLPEGADTVIMQEHVTRDGEMAILAARPKLHQSVRRKGDDLAKGAIALTKGTRLRPPHLALIASLDMATVPVAKRPVVTIVATGDELRTPGSAPREGSIPETNTFALSAMARSAGAEVRTGPAVRDDRAATERAFAEALATSDMLVTIGGVSVGDHDLVRPALEAIGAKLELWRVAIKPGKPVAIGRHPRDGRHDALVVGLPGNPASAMVTFALFGLPMLRALQGDARPFPPYYRARLAAPHRRSRDRLELARAKLSSNEEGLLVTTMTNQASGASTAMAEANALALVPPGDEDHEELRTGDEIDVLLMSELGC